nr:oligosaccharide repeat unit polymerase [Thermovirga lienii]
MLTDPSIMFYMLFFFSILILTYNAAKAPALWFLLSFIFLKVLLDGKINRKLLYGSVGIVFIIIVFYYTLTGTGLESFLSYNSGPIGRIILGQIAGLFYMMFLWPNFYSFMRIQAFPNAFLNFFNIPLEHIRPSRMVMMYVNPSGIEHGSAGVMNTLFIGEAWAMFGLIGLVLAPIIVGCIVQLFYIIILKLPKNPLSLGFYTYLCLYWPITGGFVDFIYNPGFFIIVFIIVLWYLIVSLPWNKKTKPSTKISRWEAN